MRKAATRRERDAPEEKGRDAIPNGTYVTGGAVARRRCLRPSVYLRVALPLLDAMVVTKEWEGTKG